MLNHTPRPWQVIHGKSTYERFGVEDGEGYRVCNVPNFSHRREENEANARLIAAAPDLLDIGTRLMVQLERAHDNGWGYVDPTGAVADWHALLARLQNDTVRVTT
jgi:hypothetical protein